MVVRDVVTVNILFNKGKVDVSHASDVKIGNGKI